MNLPTALLVFSFLGVAIAVPVQTGEEDALVIISKQIPIDDLKNTQIQRQGRQDGDDDDDDDDEESSTSGLNPANFGANVATIIQGVATGNLGTILKGSFGFVPQTTGTRQTVDKIWETIAGVPQANAKATTKKPAAAAATATKASATAAAKESENDSDETEEEYLFV